MKAPFLRAARTFRQSPPAFSQMLQILTLVRCLVANLSRNGIRAMPGEKGMV
jgi:hypothetical protein